WDGVPLSAVQACQIQLRRSPTAWFLRGQATPASCMGITHLQALNCGTAELSMALLRLARPWWLAAKSISDHGMDSPRVVAAVSILLLQILSPVQSWLVTRLSKQLLISIPPELRRLSPFLRRAAEP